MGQATLPVHLLHTGCLTQFVFRPGNSDYEKEHLAIVVNLKRDLKIGLGCHVGAEHAVPLLATH